jgi:hypothetical protein
VDNFKEMKKNVMRGLKFNYSLEKMDPEKDKLALLLLDASITGVSSPDNNGGVVAGSSLTYPKMSGTDFPYDDVVDGHRKLLSHNKPIHYVMGKPHMARHDLKHTNVDKTLELVGSDSVLHHPMLMRDSKVYGKAGGKVVKVSNDLLMHGHTITDDLAFASGQRPKVSEMNTVDSRDGGVVKSKKFVSLPNSVYPKSMFDGEDYEKYIQEHGAVVPIEDYAEAMFQLRRELDNARSFDLEKLGIAWNVKSNRDLPGITYTIQLRGVPIVDRYKDNQGLVPLLNYERHLENSLEEEEKPFIEQLKRMKMESAKEID